MTRLVAALRRLTTDPRPDPIGPRPWTVRLFDGVIFASPARRWN